VPAVTSPKRSLFKAPALAVLATALLASSARTAVPESSGALPSLDATTSLLVVSPHPDDETLCCAGAMQRVLAAGGRVAIVWITSGDGSVLSMLMVEKSLFAPQKVRDLAAKRMQEARAATAVLGVRGTQQLFMGYPDGGLLSLLTQNRSTPYHARLTGATRVPYAEALFPDHPYTGESLERDFAAVLDRVQPTLVLAPSPEDTHPDHRASGLLAIRALSRRGELAKARYWIVHGGEGWPSPRGYVPGIPLDTPPAARAFAPLQFLLSDTEEAAKLRAVEAYRTQLRVMAPFLLSFIRTSELYSAVAVPAEATSAR
jgi:LmbE family N-acetylglucosaminyl deacetylase